MRMQVSVHLPLDAGISAIVVRWFKAVGQPVGQGEPLAQATVSGRAVTVHSPATGVLREVFAGPGQGVISPAAVGMIELSPTGFGPAAEVIPWSRMREGMATHLVVSNNSAVHLTIFLDADLTHLIQLRQRESEAFRQRFGVPLGFAPFFVHTAARALGRHPLLNSRVTSKGMIHQREVHVGFVVDVPGGIRIPRITHANQKSLPQVAVEMHALAERARRGQLWPAEEEGSTFTVSSTGAEGPLFATPVIPYPNVAMLGFDAITDRPVAVQGRVEVRPVIYLSLSFDHRLVDGREAARFLRDVRQQLEAPAP
jgi:2-oxoglutarate dehydrogenase E2 component (dihydrolipoamide succinyltransferase)